MFRPRPEHTSLRADLAEQIVAGFCTAIAGIGTQCAMLVMIPMTFAVRCTFLTGVTTGLDLGRRRRFTERRLARQHAGSGGTDIGTVQIRADTAAQIGHVVFGEAGIGTARAMLGTIEAGIDTGRQRVLCSQWVRMGLEHGLNLHGISPFMKQRRESALPEQNNAVTRTDDGALGAQENQSGGSAYMGSPTDRAKATIMSAAHP